MNQLTKEQRYAWLLEIAEVLMNTDGYGYAADVLASSNNPKCLRWRATAENVMRRLEKPL